MTKETQEEVFGYYEEIYKHILKNMYPAKNSTGFPERNLSVNFSKAYEKYAAAHGEDAISWFEMQFGKDNKFHVDAVILNKTLGELLVIESKRFSNPGQKIAEISEDIARITALIDELRGENEQGICRIAMNEITRCYGIILADIWTETVMKSQILDSYMAGVNAPKSDDSFLNKYCSNLVSSREFSALTYHVIRMNEMDEVRRYNLVSFLWQI